MMHFFSGLALLGLSFLACGRPADPCAVHGRVTRDAVFKKACSPFVQPPGGIDIIDGATLTIEAGVEIRFNDGDWLEVGAAGKPGRLIAKGTPEDPIILTTSSPDTPRTWLGLWFHSGTLPGSELSHAVVRRAGGHNTHSQPNLFMGCLTMTGVEAGALRVSDVRVEGCEHGGFRISNSEPTLGPLGVADAGEGLVLDAAAVGLLAGPAALERVGRNVITGGVVTANTRWLAQPVPYAVTGDVEVRGATAPTLALLPGLELEFEAGRGLAIGVGEPGALQASGADGNPVVLRARDAAKPWRGVSFGEGTSAGSRIERAEVRGTGPSPAVSVRSEPARVALEHVTFADNEADVWVGCRAEPTLQNNVHSANGGVQRDTACR